MSSLPQIFKATQSAYIRPVKPAKQGGIFSVKYQTISAQSINIIQPQQFYSVKIFNKSQSRIGTSHTIRSHKKGSYRQSRNIGTSDSIRQAPSRSTYSRDSTRQIRKDIFNNYGNSRVTFAIGQTVPVNFEQAQSLVHVLNLNLKQMSKCEQSMDQIANLTNQIRQQHRDLNRVINGQLQQIKQRANSQMKRLREMLSQLRKSSGMQTKVNKIQVVQLEQGLRSIGEVMEEIDYQSAVLYKTCLK